MLGVYVGEPLHAVRMDVIHSLRSGVVTVFCEDVIVSVEGEEVEIFESRNEVQVDCREGGIGGIGEEHACWKAGFECE